MDKIKPQIETEWMNLIGEEFEKPYFLALKSFLVEERKLYRVFPPGPQIFAAFNLTPVSAVKVVIIGQDPYHGTGQANGLCFSVSDGINQPPSLKNIFKELQTDLGIPIPKTGNLEPWAKQGVLLLNATLTVRENTPGSHQNKGWEIFTDAAIQKLSEQTKDLVFLLWGNYARKKAEKIDVARHHILVAPHPSPLARGGFFGCRHFSKTNEILKSLGKKEIDWAV